MKRALGSLAVLTALTALTALSACTSDPAPGAVPEPEATTAAPGFEELSPGWDESPDGPAPTPDDRLDDAALTALLRTRATASGADHCTAGQVTVTLEGYDQAAGHRYSRVVVRNSGDEPCVVEGVPGVGARGAWGTTFVNEVGPGSSDVPAEPVRLAPGERATSDLEWTGDLAGAAPGSERISLLVLQLARGQVPVAVPARIAGDTPDDPPLDIGPLTTLRLAPFRR
ncbi:DUF4232 domain-containing protein [Pimelobacter simplex]|uniref:DUF4232 domain-containing protein n=1 Tax=Nocardioides simplex TaxID=2045 RepID=UPI0037F89D7B